MNENDQLKIADLPKTMIILKGEISTLLEILFSSTELKTARISEAFMPPTENESLDYKNLSPEGQKDRRIRYYTRAMQGYQLIIVNIPTGVQGDENIIFRGLAKSHGIMLIDLTGVLEMSNEVRNELVEKQSPLLNLIKRQPPIQIPTSSKKVDDEIQEVGKSNPEIEYSTDPPKKEEKGFWDKIIRGLS